MKADHIIVCTAVLFAACGAPERPQDGAVPATDSVRQDRTKVAAPSDMAVIAPAHAKLRVYEAPPSTSAFAGARISVEVTPIENKDEARFEFGVQDFELKAQTPDAPERGCANSPDGQHIHFILNNAPYIAKYEASFTEKVKPGRNVLLAFLSRSYHESVKQPAAFVLKEFTMKGDGGVPGWRLQQGSHALLQPAKGRIQEERWGQGAARLLPDEHRARPNGQPRPGHDRRRALPAQQMGAVLHRRAPTG
jgi:hypothetical protein